MMKLFVLSDIHLEHRPSLKTIRGYLQPADTLILAGDIGYPNHSSFFSFLQEMKKRYKNVLFVPGNHECYAGLSRDETSRRMRDICTILGVVFLDKESVLLDGVEFIGTTLWSDINDKARINDFPTVFSQPKEYRDEFKACFSFLKEKLETKSEYPRVVITHHLPCFSMIHPKFSDGVLNTAFASDILDKVCLDNVRYWFCGHTHEYSSARKGKTLIVANPVGYPTEIRKTEVSKDTFEI